MICWQGCGRELDFIVGVDKDCGGGEGNCTLVMRGVFIAALVFHMLFDAEEGYIEARDIDDVV